MRSKVKKIVNVFIVVILCAYLIAIQAIAFDSIICRYSIDLHPILIGGLSTIAFWMFFFPILEYYGEKKKLKN